MSTAQLVAMGADLTHVSLLARRGWLTRLGRGVYQLPGDELTVQGCLALLCSENHSLHVGSKTALNWRGIRHNVAVRETVELWGTRVLRLPPWLTTKVACHYQTSHLFSPAMPVDLGLSPLPGGRPEIPVSVPERALLELLSNVGKNQTLEEARYIVEGTSSLREPVLDQLMAHVDRVKVVRLAASLASEFDLPWSPVAAKHSERVGGGARWTAVTKSGERIDLLRK